MKTVPVGQSDLRMLVQVLRQLTEGRSNAGGTMTLTPNAATTDVASLTCSETSYVFFAPTSAHAAAEMGNGTMYISAKTKQQFTVTHANNAQTDRTFDWIVFGP